MSAVILIIDADPLTLTAVAAVLDMSGYECHCARDAEAALKAVRTLPLDLIICDVHLHGQCGLELCRELSNEPGAAEVPVIYVSSHQIPDIVKRVHDAGGAYYLRKPYDPDVLIELVEKALWLPHLVKARLRAEQAESGETPMYRRTESVEYRANGGGTRLDPGWKTPAPLHHVPGTTVTHEAQPPR